MEDEAKGRSKKKSGSTSKYDAFKVKVWLGDNDHHYVLSRFLVSRMLTVTRIPSVKAIKMALELKKHLVDRELLEVQQSELESILFGIMRSKGYGDSFIQCYKMVTHFYQLRQPLVILISGAPCTGKSSIAQQLAARLNMPNVMQTDVVCELLRAMPGSPLAPTPLLQRSDLSPSDVILQLQEESAAIWRALDGDLTKTLTDGKPLIFEGLHLDPGQYLGDLAQLGIVLLPEEDDAADALNSEAATAANAATVAEANAPGVAADADAAALAAGIAGVHHSTAPPADVPSATLSAGVQVLAEPPRLSNHSMDFTASTPPEMTCQLEAAAHVSSGSGNAHLGEAPTHDASHVNVNANSCGAIQRSTANEEGAVTSSRLSRSTAHPIMAGSCTGRARPASLPPRPPMSRHVMWGDDPPLAGVHRRSGSSTTCSAVDAMSISFNNAHFADRSQHLTTSSPNLQEEVQQSVAGATTCHATRPSPPPPLLLDSAVDNSASPSAHSPAELHLHSLVAQLNESPSTPAQHAVVDGGCMMDASTVGNRGIGLSPVQLTFESLDSPTSPRSFHARQGHNRPNSMHVRANAGAAAGAGAVSGFTGLRSPPVDELASADPVSVTGNAEAELSPPSLFRRSQSEYMLRVLGLPPAQDTGAWLGSDEHARLPAEHNNSHRGPDDGTEHARHNLVAAAGSVRSDLQREASQGLSDGGWQGMGHSLRVDNLGGGSVGSGGGAGRDPPNTNAVGSFSVGGARGASGSFGSRRPSNSFASPSGSFSVVARQLSSSDVCKIRSSLGEVQRPSRSLRFVSSNGQLTSAAASGSLRVSNVTLGGSVHGHDQQLPPPSPMLSGGGRSIGSLTTPLGGSRSRAVGGGLLQRTGGSLVLPLASSGGPPSPAPPSPSAPRATSFPPATTAHTTVPTVPATAQSSDVTQTTNSPPAETLCSADTAATATTAAAEIPSSILLAPPPFPEDVAHVCEELDCEAQEEVHEEMHGGGNGSGGDVSNGPGSPAPTAASRRDLHWANNGHTGQSDTAALQLRPLFVPVVLLMEEADHWLAVEDNNQAELLACRQGGGSLSYDGSVVSTVSALNLQAAHGNACCGGAARAADAHTTVMQLASVMQRTASAGGSVSFATSAAADGQHGGATAAMTLGVVPAAATATSTAAALINCSMNGTECNCMRSGARCDTVHDCSTVEAKVERARLIQHYLAGYEAQGVPLIRVQYGAFNKAIDMLHEYVLQCIQVSMMWVVGDMPAS